MRIIHIVTGSIAAYKGLALMRELHKGGWSVNPVLTQSACAFVTPLCAAALCGQPCHTDLFDAQEEARMRHITLSRGADAMLVAPASASFIARMAQGQADDLAQCLVLAAACPVFVAPAMNPTMWKHKATQRNLDLLRRDGVHLLGPATGDTACGEEGPGRMLEPEILAGLLRAHIGEETHYKPDCLRGMRALVTAGPTREALDPVRFLSCSSSGRQGFAIAAVLQQLGAETTLIAGPNALPVPPVARYVRVTSAEDMQEAVRASLPVDVACAAAAVSDFKPASSKARKDEKSEFGGVLDLAPTPDILKNLAECKQRPRLVIGFAAETHDIRKRATAKRARKGADWMLVNDVSIKGVMGGEDNALTFLTDKDAQSWPMMPKYQAALRLAGKIAQWWRGNAAH